MANRRMIQIVFVVLALAAIVGVACNYHWNPYGITFQLAKEDALRLISAVPAVKDDQGRLVAQCSAGGRPDGIILRFWLKGLRESQAPGANQDRDLSIRPGDLVKVSISGTVRYQQVGLGKSIRVEDVDVALSCIEAYPDSDNGGDCQGLPNPGGAGTPEKLSYESDFEPTVEGYYPRTGSQEGVMGVAVLVDQSGSMKGFVDKDNYSEITEELASQPGIVLEKYGTVGSDPDDQRIAALQTFISELNGNDKFILFEFGESVITERGAVVCFNPDGLEEDDLRSRCFSKDKNLVVSPHRVGDKEEPAAIDRLRKEKPVGRSPLWSALKDVYLFMRDNADTEIRHIVVIDDGPDTCHIDSSYYRSWVQVQTDKGKYVTEYQPPCATSGFQDLKDLIVQDRKDSSKPVVHISFLQIQAPGYLDRDPQQAEIACLTGGHYIFLNSWEPSRLAGTDLRGQIEQRLLDLRYSMAGYWELALALPSLGDVKNIHPGAFYSIGGDVTLKGRPDGLTSVNRVLTLRVGTTDPGVNLSSVDRRAFIRIACESDQDCSWFQGDLGECMEAGHCVEQQGLCGGKPREEETQCGTQGVCCGGECLVDRQTCKAGG